MEHQHQQDVRKEHTDLQVDVCELKQTLVATDVHSGLWVRVKVRVKGWG